MIQSGYAFILVPLGSQRGHLNLKKTVDRGEASLMSIDILQLNNEESGFVVCINVALS